MAFTTHSAQRDAYRDGLDLVPLGGQSYTIDGRTIVRARVEDLLIGAHASEWAEYEDATKGRRGTVIASFGDAS